MQIEKMNKRLETELRSSTVIQMAYCKTTAISTTTIINRTKDEEIRFGVLPVIVKYSNQKGEYRLRDACSVMPYRMERDPSIESTEVTFLEDEWDYVIPWIREYYEALVVGEVSMDKLRCDWIQTFKAGYYDTNYVLSKKFFSKNRA